MSEQAAATASAQTSGVLVGTYKLPIKALGFSAVLHALKACARART
jgi:stage V sporulation protein SpoVS